MRQDLVGRLYALSHGFHRQADTDRLHTRIVQETERRRHRQRRDIVWRMPCWLRQPGASGRAGLVGRDAGAAGDRDRTVVMVRRTHHRTHCATPRAWLSWCLRGFQHRHPVRAAQHRPDATAGLGLAEQQRQHGYGGPQHQRAHGDELRGAWRGALHPGRSRWYRHIGRGWRRGRR